jgi:hypothetical protein
MPLQVGLSAYRFKLKERRGQHWWVFAHNSPTDAYATVNGYLHDRRGHLVRLGEQNAEGEYDDQRALMLTRFVRNEGQRMLAGMMLKGEAGRILEIRNFDDPEADPTYRTGVNEGVLSPLYFRFHLEDGRQFGVVLLQTLGIDGMKGYVDADLRRYCADNCDPALTHQLTQLVDIQVLEAFAERGQLQDVIAINSGESQESREAMQRHTVGGDSLGNEGDKLQLRLHRRDGWTARVLRRLLSAIREGTDPRELIRVPGMGHIDDLRVEIAHGGRTQTFSLLNPDDSPIRQNITNDVEFGPDGLPTWESIHRAAAGVWDGIREIIG